MKDKDEAVAHYQRGQAFYEKKQFSEAINEFTRAIEFSPDNPVGYSARGAVYRQKGDIEAAISDLEKAFHIDQSDAFTFNQLQMARKSAAK